MFVILKVFDLVFFLLLTRVFTIIIIKKPESVCVCLNLFYIY